MVFSQDRIMTADPADNIEVWPLSPWVSDRQFEEWNEDADNTELNKSPVEVQRKWLQNKAQILGYPHYRDYISRLGLKLSGKVLEIGAGNFWLSSYVATFKSVESVVGVELAKARVLAFRDLTLEMFKAPRSKITYAVGDMHKIDRQDNMFDFVVCDATLHHADNLVHVLRECRRVLKPGGWFIAFREPTISRWRLRPPVFNERFPEDGSAMYYYLDGWRGMWVNGRYINIRFTRFYENRVVRGIPLSRDLQRRLGPLLLPLWMVSYPKVVMAAQKPLDVN